MKAVFRLAIAQAFVKALGAREFLLKFRTANDLFPTTRKELRTRAIQEVENSLRNDEPTNSPNEEFLATSARQTGEDSNSGYIVTANPMRSQKLMRIIPGANMNSNPSKCRKRIAQFLVSWGLIVEYPSENEWRSNWKEFQRLVARFNQSVEERGMGLSEVGVLSCILPHQLSQYQLTRR